MIRTFEQLFDACRKVKIEDLEIGSIFISHELVDEEGEDDEDGDGAVREIMVHTIGYVMSHDTKAYKFKGKGVLCKVFASELEEGPVKILKFGTEVGLIIEDSKIGSQ